jgi:hypothetical protein
MLTSGTDQDRPLITTSGTNSPPLANKRRSDQCLEMNARDGPVADLCCDVGDESAELSRFGLSWYGLIPCGLYREKRDPLLQRHPARPQRPRTHPGRVEFLTSHGKPSGQHSSRTSRPITPDGVSIQIPAESHRGTPDYLRSASSWSPSISSSSSCTQRIATRYGVRTRGTVTLPPLARVHDTTYVVSAVSELKWAGHPGITGLRHGNHWTRLRCFEPPIADE